MDNARRVFPTLGYATTAIEACTRADAVLVLTEWPEFRDLDATAIASVVNTRAVLDGRACLDREVWESSGWTYSRLGVAV